MAKAKKAKNQNKSKKITKNPKKPPKRRGRPPGSVKTKGLERESIQNVILDKNESSSYEKNISKDDYDSILIKQLKSNRKEKEKAFKDEYEDDNEEDEDSDAFIEGYDIEMPEGEEFEEDIMSLPKKAKKKRKKNYYDEFGIESEFYDSDYNIGDYE